MTETVINIVFANVMPHIWPIVMLLGAFIVTRQLMDLIVYAFMSSAGAADAKRRDEY